MRKRAHGAEAGSTLPLVTLSMFVLFGFVALAVDVGYGYSERRRAQAASDSSVLAGVLEVALGSTDLQPLADQAVALMDQNLPADVTIPDWENDAICPDTDPTNRPPGFISLKEINTALGWSITPDTHCISLSPSGSEVRVVMPTRTVDTFFAAVIGIDTMAINSFAQARLEFLSIGNPPPFVITNGVQGGDQVCLRAGSGGPQLPPMWSGNGPSGAPDPPGPPVNDGTPTLSDPSDPTSLNDSDPCDEFDASSQFFGTLNPYVYTEHNVAPPNVECQLPGANAIDFAIAFGIDHELAADWDPAVLNTRTDGQACPQIALPKFPNTMDLQTGLTAQRLRDGLLDGTTFDGIFFTGRLQQSSGGPNARFAGEELENRPLWAFLDHANIDVLVDNNNAPEQCEVVSDVYAKPVVDVPGWDPVPANYDYYDRKELMISCIVNWNRNSHLPVFVVDIAGSSLFAFIPQLHESDLTVSPVHFINFVPVYMQKLYQAGILVGNPDPFCFVQHPSQVGNAGWYMHEAGQAFDCGRSNQNVDALSSIVLECGMLPINLCEPTSSPGGNPKDPGGLRVASIELTR